MDLRFRPLAAAMAVAFSSSAMWQNAVAQTSADQPRVLDNVQVSAARIEADEPDSTTIDQNDIAARRPATSDTAGLLQNVPGVSLSSAGGVSSLPVVHGLADDRNRIKIDGMDLISACANHMNSPLSYIDPSNVEQIKVYTGIIPVSVGGDSIGGSIIVKSREPRFARAGEGLLTSGELGTFYRSNGNAWGVNAAATIANESLSISYNGSTAESGNYSSAKDFKPDGMTTVGKPDLARNEVGSSAYKTENHALGFALRHENHLLDLRLGYQYIPYQGYPNQRMDMTENRSTQINLRYTGLFDWGKLETRVYNEETRHKMDFGDDKRFLYPNGAEGMPMDTRGSNTGLQVKADIALAGKDLLRVGGELQRYRLDDWWDPSGTGGMAPNTFWNINSGQRDRFDVFGEWEANWTAQWQTQIGARSSTVRMDTGEVQGYNTTMAAYLAESTAFNQANRKRTDNNFDLSLLARYTANDTQSFEGGYSRKTRSPNLYERYSWSTGGMAMRMVNMAGDGNGYVGNLELKPEVAHTLSLTADWHDAGKQEWGVKITPFYTYVENYIDTELCTTANCNTSNATAGFRYLRFVNQDARLFGVDISGYFPLAKTRDYGAFTLRGLIGYVDGKNRETGDNLYNVMPLNAKLAIDQRKGNWSNTIEGQLVGAKDRVSEVRNELKTGSYALLNLRSSYQWNNIRFDIGLENALNKQYSLALGGAYVGQGSTMMGTNATTPYGIAVPGMGRSLYVGMNLKF